MQRNRRRETGQWFRFSGHIHCLSGPVWFSRFHRRAAHERNWVRKVLGASTACIVALLSGDFLKLVLVSFALALPVAWWSLHKWLQHFAYRIEIEWWVFFLAGLLAIAIALLTVSFQSVKAALMNPVKSLRSE